MSHTKKSKQETKKKKPYCFVHAIIPNFSIFFLN